MLVCVLINAYIKENPFNVPALKLRLPFNNQYFLSIQNVSAFHIFTIVFQINCRIYHKYYNFSVRFLNTQTPSGNLYILQLRHFQYIRVYCNLLEQPLSLNWPVNTFWSQSIYGNLKCIGFPIIRNHTSVIMEAYWTSWRKEIYIVTWGTVI